VTERAAPPARGQGLQVGRILGVPVFVAPSWVIIALLITLMFAPNVGYDIPELGGGKYAVSFAYAVLLYASVLVHELGHAVTAMKFGLPVKRITLQLLGGVTEMGRESNSPRREFAIAGAGPALSLTSTKVRRLPLPAISASRAESSSTRRVSWSPRKKRVSSESGPSHPTSVLWKPWNRSVPPGPRSYAVP
jgi:hypothetical protein